MYMKGEAIPWQRYPFVTMISSSKKVKHCTLEEARQTGAGSQLENHQINEGKQK